MRASARSSASFKLDQLYLVEVASMGRTGMAELLEQQRLVLDERRSGVATDAGAGRGLDALRRRRITTRMAAVTATGVVASAFAGAMTNAMRWNLASMQTARARAGAKTAAEGASAAQASTDPARHGGRSRGIT